MISAVIVFGCILLVLAVAAQRPAAILSLVFFQYGIDQLLGASIPQIAARPWLPQVFVAGLVGMALITVIGRDRRLTGPGPWAVTTLVTMFLGFFCLSFLWSPYAEVTPFLRSMAPYWVLMVFLAPLLIREPEDLRTAFWCMVIIGPLIIVAILINPNATIVSGRIRLDSLTAGEEASNPLALADLGAMLFMAAVLLNLSGVGKVLAWGRYAAAAAGLVLVGLTSRGELAAATIAVVLMIPLSRRIADVRRFFSGAFSIAMLGGMMYLVLKAMAGTGSMERWSGDSVEDGIGTRFEMAGDLLGAYAESPGFWLIGVGANHSYLISGNYPHNHIAQALGETGLVGIILWFGVLFTVFWHAWRSWPLVRDDAGLRGAWCVVGAFCAYFVAVGMKKSSVVDANWFMMAVVAERMAATLFYRLSTAGASRPVHEVEADDWGAAAGVDHRPMLIAANIAPAARPDRLARDHGFAHSSMHVPAAAGDSGMAGSATQIDFHMDVDVDGDEAAWRRHLVGHEHGVPRRFADGLESGAESQPEAVEAQRSLDAPGSTGAGGRGAASEADRGGERQSASPVPADGASGAAASDDAASVSAAMPPTTRGRWRRAGADQPPLPAVETPPAFRFSGLPPRTREGAAAERALPAPQPATPPARPLASESEDLSEQRGERPDSPPAPAASPFRFTPPWRRSQAD